MFRKHRPHIPSHTTVAAYLSLFLVMGGGAAYAANAIGSEDVINESLTSADLKNGAAVKSEDVANDSVTGGGLRGPDILESTLGKVPNADKLDGKDSEDFMPSDSIFVTPGWNSQTGRTGFDSYDVYAGETQIGVFGVDDLIIHYKCPAHPMESNGTAQIDVSARGYLFVDNGGDNPNYYEVPSSGLSVVLPTAPTGEALTIQMNAPTGDAPEELYTILFFSVHDPGLSGVNDGFCHVQGQILEGRG